MSCQRLSQSFRLLSFNCFRLGGDEGTEEFRSGASFFTLNLACVVLNVVTLPGCLRLSRECECILAALRASSIRMDCHPSRIGSINADGDGSDSSSQQ